MWPSCFPYLVHFPPKQGCWVGYNTTNVSLRSVNLLLRENLFCFLLVAFNWGKAELFNWYSFLIHFLFLFSNIQSNVFSLNYKQDPDWIGVSNWSFNNSHDWRSKSECEHWAAYPSNFNEGNEWTWANYPVAVMSLLTPLIPSILLPHQWNLLLSSIWSINYIETSPWNTFNWYSPLLHGVLVLTSLLYQCDCDY